MAVFDSTWLPAPKQLQLLEDEVHVWRASLNVSVERLQELALTLSTDEQSRAERFRFESHQQRFIACRAILRLLLGRYLETAPEQLQFCYGSHGKPALVDLGNKQTLQFNLSHSQDLALYAVSRNHLVGIDLEFFRPLSDLEQLTRRFFSAQEHQAIANLPPEQQPISFFQYWTCKEAYLKAIGDGLVGLEQVEISFADLSPQLTCNPANKQPTQNWSLQALTPAPDCAAALAVEGHPWHLTCWDLAGL